MVFWILLCITLVTVSDVIQDQLYLVLTKHVSVETVKLQSEKFGLKFQKQIVPNIYLFKTEDGTDNNDKIDEFNKAVSGKGLDMELRGNSKPCFVPWINDSPAPPELLEWTLTRKSCRHVEKTWQYYGMGIQEAWSMGLTGEGIVVAVVDSGVELDHEDLKTNINRKKSKSFADDDTKHGEARRLHAYQETDIYTSHGTKAAGLIAAKFGNGICSAGVAYDATLISLKVFSVDERLFLRNGIAFPDNHISQALEYGRSEIDIYSCSFGLDNTFSHLNNHIRTVLREGATQGRNGKGSIYVFAAGNLGNVYDCNTVPYANSIYTITIASVGRGGQKPDYAIPCSSVLASTYGKFTSYDGNRKLMTATLDGKCDSFFGTSASTAVASGIVALLLQANKNLTWRDVQHITVISSSFERLKEHKMTTRNGNGLQYNPYFGYGIMNATGAILLARNWTTVPAQMNYTVVSEKWSVKTVFTTTVNIQRSQCPRYIEHVRVLIAYSIEARMEKNLQITLRSPAGTRSVLLNTYVNRTPVTKYVIDRKWNYTSVQFWGENPTGNWTLRIRGVNGLEHNLSLGRFQFRFIFASFTFFGTAKKPYTKSIYDLIKGDNNHKNGLDCTNNRGTNDIGDIDDRKDNNNIFIEDINHVYIVTVLVISVIVMISYCVFLFFCWAYPMTLIF